MVDETGQLWSDPDFPADEASLYMDPINEPDYVKKDDPIEWKRPHEIYQHAQESPMMVKDGFSPGDVKQGDLGDCWLIGALTVLATNSKLLDNLIVADGIQWGFAVFRFFKNGKWQYVIVDTRLPCYSVNKHIAYAQCLDP